MVLQRKVSAMVFFIFIKLDENVNSKIDAEQGTYIYAHHSVLISFYLTIK